MILRNCLKTQVDILKNTDIYSNVLLRRNVSETFPLVVLYILILHTVRSQRSSGKKAAPLPGTAYGRARDNL